MYLRKLEVETEDGRPVPLAWLDSFAMRHFTSDARFDDTLPAGDGLLEAGLHVPSAELREAMESWFRRKGWLRPGQRLLLREQDASQKGPRRNTMQMFTLRRLLADELEEVYRAELIVQEGLPRMEKGAANGDLKKVFTAEAGRIAGQIKRLELVFSKIAESPRGGHAKSMKTLLSEFEDRMGDGGDPAVIDAALIAAGRRILNWGIASYACSQIFATRLGMDEVAGLLGQTLAERQATDARLSQLAETIPVKGNDEAS